MRRWPILVIAAAVLVQQTASGYDKEWHSLTNALSRRPSHPFFVQNWNAICKEGRTPDEDKDFTHSLPPSAPFVKGRWDRCRDSFNASANNHYPRQNHAEAANTLAHSMHYLQDHLAPRDRKWGGAMQREMVNQARTLSDSKVRQSAFGGKVDSIKADLQTMVTLNQLYDEAEKRHGELQDKYDELMMIPKGPLSLRELALSPPRRVRSFDELNLNEQNEFKSLVSQTMAINSAFTERAYELFLEKVEPGSTTDLKWEFDSDGIQAWLPDAEKRDDENRQRDAQPGAEATAPSKPPLRELAGDETGPAPVTRVDETAQQVADLIAAAANIFTQETNQDKDKEPGESDELLPVAAWGGPWSIELDGAVASMSPIVLNIKKDGTATLSRCRFQAPPLILNADLRFGAAVREGIEVDLDHPEVAVKVTFSYDLSVKAMTFIGEVLDKQIKGTATVTRQNDGTWLVEGIQYPQPLILKPVQP